MESNEEFQDVRLPQKLLISVDLSQEPIQKQLNQKLYRSTYNYVLQSLITEDFSELYTLINGHWVDSQSQTVPFTQIQQVRERAYLIYTSDQ